MTALYVPILKINYYKKSRNTEFFAKIAVFKFLRGTQDSDFQGNAQKRLFQKS
jgi:hypothetical protein